MKSFLLMLATSMVISLGALAAYQGPDAILKPGQSVVVCEEDLFYKDESGSIDNSSRGLNRLNVKLLDSEVIAIAGGSDYYVRALVKAPFVVSAPTVTLKNEALKSYNYCVTITKR